MCTRSRPTCIGQHLQTMAGRNERQPLFFYVNYCSPSALASRHIWRSVRLLPWPADYSSAGHWHVPTLGVKQKRFVCVLRRNFPSLSSSWLPNQPRARRWIPFCGGLPRAPLTPLPGSAEFSIWLLVSLFSFMAAREAFSDLLRKRAVIRA